MYATVDGKSIEDLTAEEVEVLEDGVPQKLEAFEHVQVRPAGAQESRREPNTVEQSRQMADEGASFSRMLGEPAAKEAFTAFMERRKPDFSKV